MFVHFLNNGRRADVDRRSSAADADDAVEAGCAIAYERTTFIPKFSYVGDATVQVGLFSPKTGDRLPLSGDDAGMRSYRVARFDMRPQTDNLFVVFKDGWHETEVGRRWHRVRSGSGRSVRGLCRSRNPKQDVVLFLQADQPVTMLPAPQQVDVRLGGTVIDHFALSPGARVLRRIPVTAAQLGTGETAEFTVAVDQTFRPASIAQLKSTDARELGIRVFRAYLNRLSSRKTRQARLYAASRGLSR